MASDRQVYLSTRIIGGLAAMGVAFVMRKVMTTAWTKTTGKEPPAHPEDPQVALGEALGWAVITAVGAESARLLVTRAVTKRSQARHANDL
jgi:Protein of unknown function (DUF4235)